MKWLDLIIAIIISSRLSKFLYNGTKRAETDGMACCIWMRIAFWVVWSSTFLLYLRILGLLVWVGIQSSMNGDAFGAGKMVVIA